MATATITDFTALVPVTQNNGKCWIDARRLHQALEVGRDFSNWMKGRIERFGFVEGVDYEKSSMIPCSPDLASLADGMQGRVEYSLTTDMAKQLCMVENNEKGLLARRYFIACEEKLQKLVVTEKPAPNALEAVDVTQRVLLQAGLTANQVAIGMSNTYRRMTGVDVLAASEMALPSPVQKQALTPTEIGKEIGNMGPKQINKLLLDRGYQVKRVNGGYDPTPVGEPHALLLDTAKRHSDGTPVKQLKWYTTILPVIRDWLTPEPETDEEE